MRHIASRLPIAVATDYSEAGHRTVADVLRTKPDLLVVDFPHAAVLAPPPYACPSVLFTHNVEAEIFRRHADAARDPVRRAVWRNQATKMERYERELLARFSAVVAVADRDRDYFRGTYGIDKRIGHPDRSGSRLFLLLAHADAEGSRRRDRGLHRAPWTGWLI